MTKIFKKRVGIACFAFIMSFATLGAMTAYSSKTAIAEENQMTEIETTSTAVLETVTATDAMVTVDETGALITGTAGTSYSGEIPVYLKGDLALNFDFPWARDNWTEALTWTNLTYSVVDMQGEVVFDIVYTYMDWGYTRVYVRYGDQIRSYGSKQSADWGPAYVIGTTAEAGFTGVTQMAFAPAMGIYGGNQKAKDLEIKIEDDVVKVFAFDVFAYEWEIDPMVEIAAFDGTNVEYSAKNVAKADFNGWNLPKIADRLADGYKITFAMTYAKPNVNMPLQFVSVGAEEYFNVVKVGNVTEKVAFNSEYTLPETAEEGKTLYRWKNVATEELYEGGANVNVTGDMTFVPVYNPVLTINYVDADGNAVATAYTQEYTYGADYAIESPTVEGYKDDVATVEGENLTEDTTITVTYTAIKPVLTINYVDADGNELATAYTQAYT